MNDRLRCWINKRATPTGERRSRASWIDPDSGRERAKHFERKLDAQRFLDELRGEVATGSYLDPRAGRRLFGDYARNWARAQVHRPSTSAQLESHLRTHILPTFRDRPIASIKPSDIQSFVKCCASKLAPATVEAVYRWLATIFRAAVDDGLIRSTPRRKITLPKQETRVRVVPLETEHVIALADQVGPRNRALVLTAAAAGLRQGEVFGLTLDRINFLRRTVTVDRQLETVKGEGTAFAPPKSPASFRTVPLPDLLLDALASHIAAIPPENLSKNSGDTLLFRDQSDRPWRRNRWGEFWRPIVKEANSVAGVPLGTGFHQLRHYYASLLIRCGASVKTVQERCGHASAVITLDTYGHLWPDAEDETRSAVDRVLGAALGHRQSA